MILKMITKSPFCRAFTLVKSARAKQFNLNITSQTIFGIFSRINDLINDKN